MTAALAVACGVAAAALTAVVRSYALARGLLDIPNERSSHLAPTPNGGGVAIVLAVSGACTALWVGGGIDSRLLTALLGGLAVAVVGFIDDRYRLTAASRLAIHLIAALWALAWLGGLPALRVGDAILSFGGASYAIGVLGIVWVLNLFNFMDGIDGLAAAEGISVTWGAALVAALSLRSDGVSPAAVMVGAATAGFLLWNWPPARIFMGDVGSGYLGYVIAVLAVAAARADPVALYVWFILGGLFWADATVTLLRRLFRGKAVYAAHRTHAYQWLARRWGQHRLVTLTATGINIGWLLPCAAFAELHPRWAWVCSVAALIPPLAAVVIAGAGRQEQALR